MVDLQPAVRRTAPAIKHEVYWRETEPVEPGPPLSGDLRCDVAIIGGGYTGLWTAHQLKLAEPTLDVHIIESDYAGSGASGHGDGFVTPTIGHSLAAFTHAFGTDRARVAYSVVGRSILELQRFCRKHSIDAQLEPTGYFQVATSSAQLRWLERDIELVDRLGANSSLELLDRSAMLDRLSSPAIQGAFKVGGALVNPHRLVRGLTRVVRAQGVPVHEHTPALAMSRNGSRHIIQTPGGTLSADKVLLATNAYQHQFVPFRRTVKPFWSYLAVTEPLTDDQLAQVTWPGREGFVEARNLIVFGRLTAQNRLLVGGGPAPYFYGRDMNPHRMRNPASVALLRETLARYFPMWRELRFTHAYGGCIDMTRDLVPHVGTLGDGIFYGHGYCGNGIAFTHTAGKVLRDLILERDSAYTNLLFVNGNEPSYLAEPLTWLRERTRSALHAFQDRYPNMIKRPLV
jgi:glycine/D-amino acid oxidase-like deaminating enzyme